MTVRVRFAPSPTGPLHIGGARTALFNWALARRLGGQFLLRVEDTDPERSKEEWERAILEGLGWLGLDWDEGPDKGGDFGPYRQSERLEHHLGTAAALRQAGWAYPCFCSKERLDGVREEQQARKETPRYDGHCRDLDPTEAAAKMEAGEQPVLRFRTPEGDTKFTDLVRGEVTFANVEVDDWVMVRGDGSPTYNFVCVCDDAAMEITHVVRGEEHLVNTPKQILLYSALGLPAPTFAHLPLMLGAGGKKMSKRDGDTALQDYRDQGFPADAIFNYLALQGWALDGETEVFSREQVIEHFALEDVSKGGSTFDIEKFRWLSAEHLRGWDAARLRSESAAFLGELVEASNLEERAGWWDVALSAAKDRVQVLGELSDQLAFLFSDDESLPYDEKAEANAKKHGNAAELLPQLAAWLEPRLDEGFERQALTAELKAWVKDNGFKFPQVFQPLRCALSGKPGGPELTDILWLLGKERALARLSQGAERLA